jgi:nucleoside-diphosphate-sugar epimerase
MKTVLVTGGAGYKGCILVPKLLNAGYRVLVYDWMLFGAQGLPSHPHLKVVKGDIRDIEKFSREVAGADSVVHMACISNDPSFDLDPSLSRTINYECFEPLVLASKAAGVKRFLYVSTSSVYGVSDAAEVTEEHPFVPLTDYNKYKGLCEPVLFRHQSAGFVTTVIRPATVCGCSPRMRFDLTVNILTNHAVRKGVITVFGGAQKRPNIHIEDITDLYVELLGMREGLIAGEAFNAGYENHTVAQLAKLVRQVVEDEYPEKAPIRVQTAKSNDNRSYHISSQKLAAKLGWKPKRSIEDAVRDLCRAFKEGKYPDSLTNDNYVNVRAVKKLCIQ